MCNCLDNIVIEGKFPPFIFCPYCGEKLPQNETKDELLVQEDETAFALFNELEKIIENRFDDLVVENADVLSAQLTDIINDSELALTMKVEEEKIEIAYQGHYEFHTIELFLEQEDEDSPLYTVSVF